MHGPPHSRVGPPGVVFDRPWAVVRGFTETLDAGDDEDHCRFVASLVERIETDDRRVVRVIGTAPARPFLHGPSSRRAVGSGAPGRIRTADASLRTAALYPLSYGGAADIVRRVRAGSVSRSIHLQAPGRCRAPRGYGTWGRPRLDGFATHRRNPPSDPGVSRPSRRASQRRLALIGRPTGDGMHRSRRPAWPTTLGCRQGPMIRDRREGSYRTSNVQSHRDGRLSPPRPDPVRPSRLRPL